MTEELVYSNLDLYVAVDGLVELAGVRAENEAQARELLTKMLNRTPASRAKLARWEASGSKVLVAVQAPAAI